MAGLTAGLIGAGLGAVAGSGDNTQTTTRNVQAPSGMERDLQQQSFNSYLQQLALQKQQEAGIGGAQPLQDISRQQLQNIIGGQSFNLTPEEQAQIENIRNSTVQAGTGDIQNLVNQNLSSISNSAGARGLRGQALSELQGRAVGEGARQIGNLSAQANLTAANQALALPYQRVGLQSGLAQNNANFQEQLRQQAIQNRQQLQNPVLMNTLQNERLGNASSTTTQPGSIGSVIGGALGGAGSLLGAYGNLQRANAQNAPKQYYDGGRVASNQIGKKEDIDDFQKGFGGGEDIRKSIQNIKNALGLEDHIKNMAHGGVVPGRAMVHGDSPINDTIKINASPGEIMIPRSFAHDKHLARAFVDHIFRNEEKSSKEKKNGTS